MARCDTCRLRLVIGLLVMVRSADAFIVPNREIGSRRIGGNDDFRPKVRFGTRAAPIQARKDDDSDTQFLPSLWKSSSNHSASPIAVAFLFVAIILSPLEVDVGFHHGRPEMAIVQSSASALTEQQLLVADAWKEVTKQFVDTTYNGLGEEGWRQKRLDAVKQVTNVGPDDKEIVYAAIRDMLKALGDPYTRFLTPEQFETIKTVAKGGSGSAGIGVQLVLDPASGKVVDVNTVKDGPSQKAGVLPGDVIVEVDGLNMDGATAELVAAKCRGETGSGLNLAVRHGNSNGIPDRSITQLSLTRQPVKVNPVEASTFVTTKGTKVGLLKVSSFSTETTTQVVQGLRELGKTSAIAVDLRGNVGGYMPAGVDVAKLFLKPQARVISEVDKTGRATIYINDGVGSETDVPLYLLVDEKTASASEILTAALQDNHRATVVGTRTFGKGRIQNVQELEDGSGIAVTKAKYMTPEGRDIHGVGIAPDAESKTCKPDNSAADCLSGLQI
jgi:carboxyl-terminal processing protease